MPDQDSTDVVEQVFHQAMDIPFEQRAAYLDDHCPNAGVRAEVEALLAHADTPGVMDSPLFAATIPAEIHSADAGVLPAVGRIIGSYRLLEVLGEGGFGVVYLAEQSEPVRRRIALKIIKPGMDSRQVAARFEAERHALALMDHPNVARVLDAGTTLDGRPYFVMEHVAGIPITNYCDLHCLNTRQRLELFSMVCDAVQHAHQKGIIHRDIKPSNVLLAAPDGRPTPKVIDFGVAKAIHARLTDHTAVTLQGQLIGTPAYMSPEQAEFSGLNVDTRTDIYSLGVLLYVLLVGETPFADATFRNAGYGEIQRIIREVEPPRPSTRLETAGALSGEIARKRATEVPALRRQLSGDLDWITMKALEKDRTRRYASASELAEDVRRHLSHEVIRARPPSAAYRLRKFARRHRTSVGAAAAVVVALVCGLAIALRGLRAESLQRLEAERNAGRAKQETKRAEQALAEASAQRQLAADHARSAAAAAARATAVSTFMRHMLTAVDPAKTRGRDVTARELLDAAAKRVSKGEFKSQPDVDAEVRSMLGEMYLALGELRTASRQLSAAIRIDRKSGARGPRDLAATLFTLGRVREAQNRRADAARLLAESMELLESLEPRDDETLAVYRTYHMRVSEAGYTAEQGQSTLQTVLSGASSQDLSSDPQGRQLIDRAEVLMTDSKLKEDEASAFLDEGLKFLEAREGADHPMLMKLRVERAEQLRKQGKLDSALAMITAAAESLRRVHGDHHHELASALHVLGVIRRERGELELAEAPLRQALSIRQGRLGENNTLTTDTMHQLALVMEHKGAFAAAEALNRDALALRRADAGTNNIEIAQSLDGIANCLCGQGKPGDAEPLLRESLAIHRDIAGPASPATARIHENLGNCLAQLGRHADAVDQWRACLAIWEKRLNPGDSRQNALAAKVADLYERIGDDKNAARVRAATRPAATQSGDK